jgi:hypothetical protein
LAQRVSDSKASMSEIGSRPNVGRTIKDLSQQPIRLMDRATLRTYVYLLDKELTCAKSALQTLDANEGVLAGAGAGHHRHYGTSPLAAAVGGGGGDHRSALSRMDSGTTGGFANPSTPMSVARSGMTPTAASYLGNATGLGGGVRMMTSSPKAGNNNSGNSSRPTAANAFQKYIAPISSSTSSPGIGGVSPVAISASFIGSSSMVNVRGTSSIAPLPPPHPAHTSSGSGSMSASLGFTSSGQRSSIAPPSSHARGPIEMKSLQNNSPGQNVSLPGTSEDDDGSNLLSASDAEQPSSTSITVAPAASGAVVSTKSTVSGVDFQRFRMPTPSLQPGAAGSGPVSPLTPPKGSMVSQGSGGSGTITPSLRIHMSNSGFGVPLAASSTTPHGGLMTTGDGHKRGSSVDM